MIDVATYCDHAFEAAQRALVSGELEQFQHWTKIHRAYSELYHHLNAGGMIQ